MTLSPPAADAGYTTGSPARVEVTITDDEALAFPVPDTGPVVLNYPGRVGTALAPLPAATGGTAPITYELDRDPALPDGLTFDPATRGFTGLPTRETPRRTYRLTATDAAGQTAILTFTISIGLDDVTATLSGPASVDEDAGTATWTITLSGVPANRPSVVVAGLSSGFGRGPPGPGRDPDIARATGPLQTGFAIAGSFECRLTRTRATWARYGMVTVRPSISRRMPHMPRPNP